MSEHELARADREHEERISIPPSPYVWMMDSEFCCRCGAALDFWESTLCFDCYENQAHDEEQARYEVWDDEDDNEEGWQC